MATYVYETIPQKPGQKVRHLEIKQSMKDEPLTQHPETGEPIRRVISGGFGTLSKAEGKSVGSTARSGHGGSCGCGAGGCRN
jgi:predicted nucleic acid-binding Zn ribbon protein